MITLLYSTTPKGYITKITGGFKSSQLKQEEVAKILALHSAINNIMVPCNMPQSSMQRSLINCNYENYTNQPQKGYKSVLSEG